MSFHVLSIVTPKNLKFQTSEHPSAEARRGMAGLPCHTSTGWQGKLRPHGHSQPWPTHEHSTGMPNLPLLFHQDSESGTLALPSAHPSLSFLRFAWHGHGGHLPFVPPACLVPGRPPPAREHTSLEHTAHAPWPITGGLWLSDLRLRTVSLPPPATACHRLPPSRFFSRASRITMESGRTPREAWFFM